MEWQPIETLHADLVNTRLFFWIVPKTPEEAYCNTSGDPIFGTFEPYLMIGKYKSWSSLSKATHWMPLPAAPRGPGPEAAD